MSLDGFFEASDPKPGQKLDWCVVDEEFFAYARDMLLSGKDMLILGSANFASFLLQRGLIDEYRVILNPVFLGSGTPLFQDVKERLRLKLSRTKLFGSGVVVLYYQSA